MKNHCIKKSLIPFVLGILFLATIRLFTMEGEHVTHYHANFALFTNGQRVDLTDDKYMEDIAGCKPNYLGMQPEERTHMHNNDHNVVHVHHDGVTWGHFFSNIGYTLSDQLIISDTGQRFENTAAKKISFILNGQAVDSIQNKLIESEDRLLVSYGNESLDQLLETQFSEVESNAKEHNEHPDPGSCSGAIELGFWERLKKAFW